MDRTVITEAEKKVLVMSVEAAMKQLAEINAYVSRLRSIEDLAAGGQINLAQMSSMVSPEMKKSLLLGAASKLPHLMYLRNHEDEITDTREGKEKKNLSQLLKNSLTIVNESKLTPAQRIRYRYQRLLKKHSQWPGSSTARENLPGEMAPYYEKARYSQKTVSAEEAETFAEGIKDL